MRRLRTACFASAAALPMLAPIGHADNQTDNLSPFQVGGAPFNLRIEPVAWDGDPLPAIHSAATARLGDRLLFVGGKSSGLHGFSCSPTDNFPAADFSRDLMVVDLSTGEVHTRSLDAANSGLTADERSAMASINTLHLQVDGRLLVVGGYGVDPSGGYVTFDTLRTIDIAGIIDWTIGDRSMLADHVTFVNAPADAPGELATTFFTLTGGDLQRVPTTDGDEFRLCLGQSFQQGYGCTPGNPGQSYSRRIRRFAIDLEATPPTAHFIGQSPAASWARRRDLNVFPARVPTGTIGAIGAIAAAGPFTPGPDPGIWTVPILVGADGDLTMDDPTDPATLRQGFAAYASATLPFWSAAEDANWLVSLGGIGFAVVANGQVAESGHLPYDNSGFALRYAPTTGTWSQHLLLDASFPALESESGTSLFHGTETMVFPSIPGDEADMFDLDTLLATARTIGEPIEVAILHGGIVAEGQGVTDFPPTAASNLMFRVTIAPNDGCTADFDDDGEVEGADLGAMLAGWGPVPSTAIQPADLDGDGVVNGADLGLLLGQWGRCGG